MLHLETEIHSTDLFKWLLSASSLSDHDCHVTGWHLHVCQEPHFLLLSISATSTFKLCPWWTPSREGASTVRRRKEQDISFPCSHFSAVKKDRVVSKNTLNCWHFSHFKVTWSADSSVLFSLHFRLIATSSGFCFVFLCFVLFCFGCLSLPRSTRCTSVKEIPSSGHGWLSIMFREQLQPKGRRYREIIFCLTFSAQKETWRPKITVQNDMNNSDGNSRNF